MVRTLGLACLVLLVPSTVSAAETARSPEDLLAGDSVAYFRFDGLEPHRKAYDKTALAEIMRGDLGDLLAELSRLAKESVGFGVVKDKLLAGLPPEKVTKIHQAARKFPGMLAYLQQHGVMVGVEMLAVLPPRVRVTVVFPHGGLPQHRAAICAGLHLFAVLSDLAVQESKLSGRTVSRAIPATSSAAKKGSQDSGADDPDNVAWWQEGDHIVLTFGTEKPDLLVRQLDDKNRAKLSANTLFRAVVAFKRYETLARGFVDLERGLQKAQALGPLAKVVIDQLGLAALKSLTVHIGFSGRYQQSSVVLSLAGQRKGVLKLIPSAEVSLDQLPPLPPDAVNVTAVAVDAGAWVDFANGLHRITGLLSGGGQDLFAETNRALGIDLRKDLIDTLGSTAVLYNSPGEGFSLLGEGLAIKVKDELKLKAALETLKQKLVGDAASVKKTRYRGVDVYSARFGMGGFFLPLRPSWTVHKGWLVVGLNPPSVKGHILRSSGRFAGWQPPPLAREQLAELKKDPKVKVLAVCTADTRASLKQALALGQLFIEAYSTFQQPTFDSFLVPHFQSLTEPMSPNVMVLVDDGDTIRLETRGWLPLPTDVVGIEGLLFVSFLGLSF